MIYYVDTNYFLRFFLDDNQKQTEVVRELFEKGSQDEVDLRSSIVVFLEVYWVLKSFYSFPKSQITELLGAMLKMDFIKFDDEKIMLQAIKLFSDNNLNLEDCFHLAYVLENNGEDKKLATFDKRLKKVLDFV
ncbi:PIN domain-containing protein [Patescibacteria group bacterium]|nr:PIN domain-containing protein [Patescibacteria group bacterium]